MVKSNVMEIKTTTFDGKPIHYKILTDNGMLLKKEDVISVIGISDPSPELLSLDLQDSIYFALANQQETFAEWLQKNFAGYSLETLIRPGPDTWE
jgi:hypothetical protein